MGDSKKSKKARKIVEERMARRGPMPDFEGKDEIIAKVLEMLPNMPLETVMAMEKENDATPPPPFPARKVKRLLQRMSEAKTIAQLQLEDVWHLLRYCSEDFYMESIV